MKSIRNEKGSILIKVIALGGMLSGLCMVLPSYITPTQNKLYERHTEIRLTNDAAEIRMMFRTADVCLRILGPALVLENNQAVYTAKEGVLNLVKKSVLLPVASAGAVTELLKEPTTADKIDLGPPLVAGKKIYRASFNVAMGMNGIVSNRPSIYAFPVYLAFGADNRLVECQGTQISKNDTLTTEDRICRLQATDATTGTLSYNPETRSCEPTTVLAVTGS